MPVQCVLNLDLSGSALVAYITSYSITDVMQWLQQTSSTKYCYHSQFLVVQLAHFILCSLSF